jgi:hypothetical protein
MLLQQPASLLLLLLEVLLSGEIQLHAAQRGKELAAIKMSVYCLMKNGRIRKASRGREGHMEVFAALIKCRNAGRSRLR